MALMSAMVVVDQERCVGNGTQGQGDHVTLPFHRRHAAQLL